jgi:hypothetical protein
MADSFHILLPSNSSMDRFPNNTVANYITQLYNNIALDGLWEMALTEIHFPYTCYNTYKPEKTTKSSSESSTILLNVPNTPLINGKPYQPPEQPSHIYVYCDLVEPQIIGDTLAPIIRMVNTDFPQYAFGENVTKSFVSLQYVPLMKKSFSTVEIDLRDNTGNLIPFCAGHSAVTLHFRRRRIRDRSADQ